MNEKPLAPPNEEFTYKVLEEYALVFDLPHLLPDLSKIVHDIRIVKDKE